MSYHSGIYRSEYYSDHIILDVMQRFSNIILLCAALVLASCDGGSHETITSVYTISVDKTRIESDGIDVATFVITDSDGNIVTKDENMASVYFKNVKTGIRLPRYSTGFSSIADGEFEFAGIYNGIQTVNTVKVKSVNRASYEVFHKNVAVFKLTGTWCPNCPKMTASLHALDKDALDHSIVLACHHEEMKSHPFYVDYGGISLGMSFFHYFQMDSYSFPTNCYDMVQMSGSISTVTISDIIMDRRIKSPAAVGIMITSVALEGSSLKVSATVKASAYGHYDMACALVADGLVYAGGYTDNDRNMYSNVVLNVSGNNFMRYVSDTSFNLEKDAEHSRDFEFVFTQTPSSEILKNMRAVILVHRKTADGKSEVNNCAECVYGSTLDYRYN